MKRQLEITGGDVEMQEEGYLIFPTEVYLHILGFVSKYDAVTYLALISTERRAIVYMRSLIVKFVHEQLTFMVGYEHTEKKPYSTLNKHSSLWTSYGIFKDIVCWTHSMAAKVHASAPESIPILYTAKVAQHLHEKLVRYMKFLVLDKRYQTTQHWSALFSFVHLCQLHGEAFFIYDGESKYYPRSRDLSCSVNHTTLVSHVKYYDSEKKKVTRLMDMPGIRTIGVVISQPNTLNARAVEQVNKKYATNHPTKHQVLLFALRSAPVPLQFSLTYSLLRDQLKLREVRQFDPIKALVIEPIDKKKNKKKKTHHICATEHADLLKNCYTYEGTEEETLAALRLAWSMGKHCRIVEKLFEIPQEEELLPLEANDRTTKRVNWLFSRGKKTDTEEADKDNVIEDIVY